MFSRRTLGASLVCAAALALTGCGSETTTEVVEQPPVAKTAAPAGTEWSQVINATEEGGFVMGNPDAPISFVEYGALSCSHCRDFAQEATEELHSDFINTGQVKFEFRNYLLNAVDALAGTIMTCGGQDRFYPLMENIYANQSELLARGGNLEQVLAQTANIPDDRKYIAMAQGLGLYDFFQARGFSEGELNACLSDPSTLRGIQARATRDGEQYGITGTPTFLINGNVVADTNVWGEISERLEAAGAR